MSPMRVFSLPWVAAVAFTALMASAERAGAAAASDADIRHFERNVRPVLVEHCYSCHSDRAGKRKGGLRMDRRDTLLRGGDTGPAIIPGRPGESLLVRAVGHVDDDLRMPPKTKLPDAVIADLTKWVTAGAPWPAGDDVADPVAPPSQDGRSADGRSHWAFRPVRPAGAPAVRDAAWPRSDVDRFILAKLEERGLRPSPPADRRALLRRATYDLTGLPPTPEEVAAFLSDGSPDAFATVVDRLLASPAYGERWGRRWLDLARYADSNGADENYAHPNAWRYRDYVIRSLNADKPYNQFVREQVAGDLLAGRDGEPDADRHDRLTATGFLVLGPKMLAEQDKPKLVMDIVDEQLDVVGQTFLGLTIGCARCHDHKFDPVPASDYYALAGIFKSTRTMANLGFVSEPNERPLLDEASRPRWEAYQAELANARVEVEQHSKDAKSDEQKKLRDAAKKRLAELEKAVPDVPRAMAVADGEPQDVPVHVRGNHLTLAKQPTPRGFVTVLAAAVVPLTIPNKSSGRPELAGWLTDPANPLTARVMVNRVWQGHFGVGLVATPSNFGLRGSPPSHPDLLDWLADRFVADGWSLKRLHRLILLSAVYQQSSAYDATAAGSDPGNVLLWRQNRRRLEAEPIRDALHAAAGTLDRTMSGSLAAGDGKREKYSRVPESDPAFRSTRRAIYLPVVRNRTYEMFTTFDYTDAGVHTPARPVTTVPPQALFMLNSELVATQARAMAERLLADRGPDDAARVGRAYELLYARPATDAERDRAAAYVSSATAEFTGGNGGGDEARLAAWTSLCRVLMAANEFVYVN